MERIHRTPWSWVIVLMTLAVINGIGLINVLLLRVFHENRWTITWVSLVTLILVGGALIWRLAPERKYAHTRFSELTLLEKGCLLVALLIQITILVVIGVFWPQI